MDKLYAQFNEENICICVSTHKTDVEATYENLGQRYTDGYWEVIEAGSVPYQPTNAEIAQLVSDLYADLIIAGVI